MAKVLVLNAPPSQSKTLGPSDRLAYFDVRAVPLKREVTALEAWDLTMSRPIPGIALAFRLRDAISSLFGVKKIGGFTGDRQGPLGVGDKIDFFLIEEISDQVLVLTERDKHLDVMTSVTTTDGVLAITSSVITHNLFGRIYMIPVGVAHKIIVNLMLAQVGQVLNVPRQELSSN